MSCETWRDQIDRYVDGELEQPALADFEAHLRGCSACSAEALGRLQMKRLTQASGMRYAPAPAFRLKIEDAVQAKKKSRWSFGFIPKLVTAAVIICLVVLSSLLWVRRSTRQQALTELADLHVATLASVNPVDVVSTDRHTVKPWFAGKLPFTFNLPELDNSPFKLVGGRVAYLEQNPAAQLLFEVRKHRLSVFITEDRATLPFQRDTTAKQLDFNLESFSRGGLRYWIVSDVDPTDVRQLGELLKRAGP